MDMGGLVTPAIIRSVYVQSTATPCNTLQHMCVRPCYPRDNQVCVFTKHCNTLQHTTTHLCETLLPPRSSGLCMYKALQHTATHCNTLQHTALHGVSRVTPAIIRGVCVQSTATHCNTLQHTATHCNTLQHACVLWITKQQTERESEREL